MPRHLAGDVHQPVPRIPLLRNDITDLCRSLIVQAYGEFKDDAIYGDKGGVYCRSRVFEASEFGYHKIVVERPERDEQGNVVMKRGKPVADASLRDTENVPMNEDIDAYFKREVLPYAPDAWIDKSKTKVGYEIPMTRYFYEYQAPEKVEDIMERIKVLEHDISDGLRALFYFLMPGLKPPAFSRLAFSEFF